MSNGQIDVRAVFASAQEIESPAERSAYLDQACGGDAALRAEVESLLAAHKQAGSFMQGTAAWSTPTSAMEPSSEQAGTVIGPYKLLQKIGEGGMGVVFMAEQTQPVHRTVALKIIKPGMDTRRVIARFEAERQALAMMDHPNIAKVLDAGTTNVDRSIREREEKELISRSQMATLEIISRSEMTTIGRPYFVMELVQGVPITEYCDQCNLTTRERLELFVAVCQAVQHAHQKGVIHRDLKPTNVLVAMQDGRPAPKIIDFGVAKALSQRLTEHTLMTGFAQMVGTPMYMSPEQAELSPLGVDTRSDIYSLGVLLYELLTGATPFDKDRLHAVGHDELRRIIREEEPPRPSDRLSSLSLRERAGVRETAKLATTIAEKRRTDPHRLIQTVRGELDWIVMKCLEKDRNRRYETASGLGRDIERYLQDEPVQACPPSAAYRFHKLARRHKAALISAVAIVVMLLGSVAILAVSNAQVRRESAAREIALKDKDAALKDRDQALVVAREKESLERSRYYAAQMNLASQAWKSGQHVRTVELLETLRPRAGEPDARGFEWYYLYRLSHPNVIRRWRAHWRWVTDIAWNPDGSLMATASLEPAIRLWDGRTSKFLANLPTGGDLVNLPTGGEWGVWEIAWSNDGSTLAAACQNGEVILWDMPARRERRRWMVKPEPDGVWALAISPDGRLLATDSYGVKLWNVSDGSLVAHLPGHQTDRRGRIMAIAFSPDGATLASADASWAPDPSIILWDLKAEPRKLHELQHLGADELVYAEDGNTLWAASKYQIKTIDVATGDIRGTFQGPTANPTAMAALPGSQQLVTASEDHTVRLWDLKSGTYEIIDAELSTVRSVTADPKGEFIAWGDNIGQIVLRRSAARETNPIIPILPSKQWVRSLQFTPDSRSLVVGTRPAQLIDVATRAKHSLGKTQALNMSRDATLLAEYDDKSCLTIRNLKDDLPSALLNVGRIDFARFSPDGKLLAAWDMWEGTELQLWDTASEKLVHRFGPYDQVINAAFSPDSNRIAISNYLNYPRNVGIYDVRTKKRIVEVPVADSPYSALHLLFSPDGSELAVGLSNGEVLLLDVAKDSHTPNLRARLRGHFPHINALAFSPDGRTLATSGAENSVRLWDLETLQERISVDIDARHLAFSPDGNLLAAIDDQTVVRWLDATADPSARALRTWRDRADFDQLMVGAYAAWESGDEPQVEEKLLSAIRTLEPEVSPAANINVFDRLVRCHLNLHLLRTLERRTTEAQQSLEEAKQLLAEMPDYLKQLTAARFRAEGPKSAAKDQLADALFPPAATNDN